MIIILLVLRGCLVYFTLKDYLKFSYLIDKWSKKYVEYSDERYVDITEEEYMDSFLNAEINFKKDNFPWFLRDQSRNILHRISISNKCLTPTEIARKILSLTNSFCRVVVMTISIRNETFFINCLTDFISKHVELFPLDVTSMTSNMHGETHLVKGTKIWLEKHKPLGCI